MKPLDDDWYTPEVEEDGEELGLIYFNDVGYTPNDVREFIDVLEDMITTAEDAVRL